MKASPREGHAGLPLAPRRLCTRWEDMMYQYATKYKDIILLKIRSALEIPPPAPPTLKFLKLKRERARAMDGSERESQRVGAEGEGTSPRGARDGSAGAAHGDKRRRVGAAAEPESGKVASTSADGTRAREAPVPDFTKLEGFYYDCPSWDPLLGPNLEQSIWALLAREPEEEDSDGSGGERERGEPPDIFPPFLSRYPSPKGAAFASILIDSKDRIVVGERATHAELLQRWQEQASAPTPAAAAAEE